MTVAASALAVKVLSVVSGRGGALPARIASLAATTVIFVMALPTSGCTSGTDQRDSSEGHVITTETGNVSADVSHDSEALSKLTPLPVIPTSVAWTRTQMGVPDSRVPGPTDYQVVAVIDAPDARGGLEDAGFDEDSGTACQLNEVVPDALVSEVDDPSGSCRLLLNATAAGYQPGVGVAFGSFSDRQVIITFPG